MKDQYVGDVGDYGKYGLIRHLLGVEYGIALGINWYHTPDFDNNKDGHKRDYIRQDNKYRQFDPVLFDVLKGLQDPERRRIDLIEESGILPGVSFSDRVFDTRNTDKWEAARIRMKWFRDSMDDLEDRTLVFLDPDTGLSFEPDMQYLWPSEVEGVYHRGIDVLYYHHRDHGNTDKWERTISFMNEYIPEARILSLTFHPWGQREYVFVIHPEKYEFYKGIVMNFLKTEWGTVPVTSSKEPVFTMGQQ